MTFSVSTLCLASGAPLLFRIDSHLLRGLGAALFTVGFVMAATPAFADENILAVDNGEVRCRASKADLTRISLKDDRFVSVSRVQTGVEGQDFSIVHEPTRGDIYISVPEAYSKPNISFFGTTQKGIVYKFDCQIGGDSAVQVFVANADIENLSAKPEVLTASGSLQDRLGNAGQRQAVMHQFGLVHLHLHLALFTAQQRDLRYTFQLLEARQ